MSRTILFIAFILASIHGEAQSVGISTNGAAPHASAMLDVSVSGLPANGKKGMLVPRMSSAERTAIVTPAQGLLVFDTTRNEFWYYDGAVWASVAVAGTLWNITGNAGTLTTEVLGTLVGSSTLEMRVNNERSAFTADADTRVSFGHLALPGATGVNNTAFGKYALQDLGNGTNNTAIGLQALSTVYGNSSCTAVGFEALINSVGARNTAVGYRALYLNTTGADNTAIGLSALRSNTTGSRNTAVGSGALENATASDNTAFGYQALNQTTNGSSNTAMGSGCMRNNTTGAQNAAMGYLAMEFNTTGQRNCAMGTGASHNNVSGSYNVAFGKDALYANLASYNTASGMSSASGITTGAYNTGFGYNCLAGVTTGNYNTAIGSFAGAAGNYTNTTAVGYGASPSATNRITIGTAANLNLTGGYGTWQNFSDARFKRDVLEDVPGLDLILALRPVSYRLNAEAVEKHLGHWYLMDTLTGKDHRTSYMVRIESVAQEKQTGFIAQEVEAALMAIGASFDVVHHPVDTNDHYTLGYEQFTLPLIEAVQQQQRMIEKMETMNAELRKRLHLLIQADDSPSP